MTTARELLEESAHELRTLRQLLAEDGDSWLPWQRSHFQVLVEEAIKKKNSAMALMNTERFYLAASDPEPQVTGHCPFCGRWYRDSRTACTDGCGGTLTEVKRVSLKARRVSYSTIPVIGGR